MERKEALAWAWFLLLGGAAVTNGLTPFLAMLIVSSALAYHWGEITAFVHRSE